MSRFSHKHILLYGSGNDSPASVGSVFSEIAKLRVVRSTRQLVDEYVALILKSAQNEWMDTFYIAGVSCCRKFREHNRSLMSIPEYGLYPSPPDDTNTVDVLGPAGRNRGKQEHHGSLVRIRKP